MSEIIAVMNQKGGCGKTSHGHLDAGSFVFDAKGYRWAMDLGMTGYSTIEKMLAELGGNLFDVGQNSLRWSVFRLKNESHSTITSPGRRLRQIVGGYRQRARIGRYIRHDACRI